MNGITRQWRSQDFRRGIGRPVPNIQIFSPIIFFALDPPIIQFHQPIIKFMTPII